MLLLLLCIHCTCSLVWHLLTGLLVAIIDCIILNISLTAPSRVTGVSLTRTVENGTSALRVTWNTPHSEVAISQYKVQYKSGTISWSSATTILVSPTATSTILTGLDAGTEYNVRVRVESDGRAGNWSMEQKERTFSHSGFYVLSVCIYTCGAHSVKVE